MLHLLACLTVEAGIMQIDLVVPSPPINPVQQILDIAKVQKSEVVVFRWDLEVQEHNQPIDCSKLKHNGDENA